MIFFTLIFVATECISCLGSICGEIPPKGCKIRLTSEVNIAKLCSNNQCNTTLTDSIVECDSNGTRLLHLDNREVQVCSEFASTSPVGRTVPVSPGFYIFEHIRFCTNQCVDKVMIRTSSSSSPSSVNPIQFHVYKRYRPSVAPNAMADNNYFVEQRTFDVTLSYNKALTVYEGIPIGPPVCFNRGDYFGITLNEDIGLLANTLILPTEGVHVGVPRTRCLGITSTVFDVHPFKNFNELMSPLVSMIPSTGSLFCLCYSYYTQDIGLYRIRDLQDLDKDGVLYSQVQL